MDLRPIDSGLASGIPTSHTPAFCKVLRDKGGKGSDGQDQPMEQARQGPVQSMSKTGLQMVSNWKLIKDFLFLERRHLRVWRLTLTRLGNGLRVAGWRLREHSYSFTK